jgi:hypothetical protein
MNEAPTSALGTLMLMPSTQTQVDVFSDMIIQSVKEGEINPIELLVQLKALEKATERIVKEIKENVLTEASKYPGNSFDFKGNKIERAELGTKYDYSKCNDPIWENLDSKASAASNDKKDRETFLKAIKDKETIVDPNTGEVVTIYPPLKTSTTGLKVSIK